MQTRLSSALPFLAFGLWFGSAQYLFAFQPVYDDESILYGNGLIVVDSTNKILGNLTPPMYANSSSTITRYVNGTWVQFYVDTTGISSPNTASEYAFTTNNCTGQKYLAFFGVPEFAYLVVSSTNDVTLYFAGKPFQTLRINSWVPLTVPCTTDSNFFGAFPTVGNVLVGASQAVDIGVFTPPFEVKTLLQIRAERVRQ